MSLISKVTHAHRCFNQLLTFPAKTLPAIFIAEKQQDVIITESSASTICNSHIMKPAAKRCLYDYFNARKKFPGTSKDVDLLKSVKESVGKTVSLKATTVHCVKGDDGSTSDKNQSKTNANENSIKRRISTDSENNNTPTPAKRLCTAVNPRTSNLLVSAEVKKDERQARLEMLKNRLNKFKQTVATTSETLEKSSESSTENSQKAPVPAYQIYAGLAAEDSSELVLPYKYKTLLETFQCLDTVVSMLYNRNETCFIDKIQTSVQTMTRRSFTLNHLGQIVTVNPKAYNLTIEPKPKNSFRNKNGDEKDLLVNPNLTDVDGNGIDSKERFTQMVPKVLLDRKNTFKSKLIEMTKIHHQTFLASLKKPITINNSDVRRWHPSFLVDNVPDIKSAEIPRPNQPQVVTTAKDVLEKVKGIYSKQLDLALETVAANSAATSTQSASTETKSCTTKPSIKGIPQSLLEKIRAKEAAKTISSITRDVATENKLRKLSRLPDIARIVKTLFVGERKTALTVPYVVEKIDGSYIGSLTYQEIEDHLKLLSNLVPEWLSLVQLNDGSNFYKLKREMDFNTILAKISSSSLLSL